MTDTESKELRSLLWQRAKAEVKDGNLDMARQAVEMMVYWVKRIGGGAGDG